MTTIENNGVVRAGCLDPDWLFGVGAVWFYALDEDMTGEINVSSTTIADSPYEAIHFIGSSVTNVAFDNINITNVGTFVFQLQCGGQASVSDVVASGVGYYGQYNCGVSFVIDYEGEGNDGWNTTHCGFPPT